MTQVFFGLARSPRSRREAAFSLLPACRSIVPQACQDAALCSFTSVHLVKSARAASKSPACVSMCVCVYMCVYVCVYVYMYAYICIYIHTYAYMYADIHIYISHTHHTHTHTRLALEHSETLPRVVILGIDSGGLGVALSCAPRSTEALFKFAPRHPGRSVLGVGSCCLLEAPVGLGKIAALCVQTPQRLEDEGVVGVHLEAL